MSLAPPDEYPSTVYEDQRSSTFLPTGVSKWVGRGLASNPAIVVALSHRTMASTVVDVQGASPCSFMVTHKLSMLGK